jgi:hypothetical protein
MASNGAGFGVRGHTMANRTYIVSIYPATSTDGCISISLSLIAGSPRHWIEAPNIPDMLRQVKELQAAFGQSCSASVSVPKGHRKPPGFDKATKGWMFHEHIVEQAEA